MNAARMGRRTGSGRSQAPQQASYQIILIICRQSAAALRLPRVHQPGDPLGSADCPALHFRCSWLRFWLPEGGAQVQSWADAVDASAARLFFLWRGKPIDRLFDACVLFGVEERSWPTTERGSETWHPIRRGSRRGAWGSTRHRTRLEGAQLSAQ